MKIKIIPYQLVFNAFEVYRSVKFSLPVGYNTAQDESMGIVGI